MSEHLEKAKTALAHAADLDVDLEAETLPKKFSRLITIAEVQAQVAQAEALTRIAEALECAANQDMPAYALNVRPQP